MNIFINFDLIYANKQSKFPSKLNYQIPLNQSKVRPIIHTNQSVVLQNYRYLQSVIKLNKSLTKNDVKQIKRASKISMFSTCREINHRRKCRQTNKVCFK